MQQLGVPVTAVYGSDFSVAGYHDTEFNCEFSWDTDLLSGYTARFLTTVESGGPATSEATRSAGLSRIIGEVNPQAVLLLGYSSRFDRGALVQVVHSRTPVLFRGETCDHARKRRWWKRYLRDTLLRWFYRHCCRLLPIGLRSYEHYRRLGCREEQLVFSPYCVDTTPFQLTEEDRARLRERTRRELGVSPETLLVLFSGKLARRKGVDLLPHAIHQASMALARPMALALLGSGELRVELEKQVCGMGSVSVHFLGFQNQSRLSPYYHAADLLVLASRASETWGLVVNEALHHGLPCVVSEAVGCTPDLLRSGETGQVCRPDDAASLAEALIRAAPLVGRLEIRNQCRALVERYSLEAAAQGIVARYRDVVG